MFDVDAAAARIWQIWREIATNGDRVSPSFDSHGEEARRDYARLNTALGRLHELRERNAGPKDEPPPGSPALFGQAEVTLCFGFAEMLRAWRSSAVRWTHYRDAAVIAEQFIGEIEDRVARGGGLLGGGASGDYG